MQKRPGIIIIIIQSVIIALLLVYLVFSFIDKDPSSETDHEALNVKQLLEIVSHRNDSLSLLLQELRITNGVPPLLDSSQLRDLKKLGLKNPVEDIRNDLVSESGLINASGVLGGKMGFYFTDGIHILNKRWVIAYFEDGHVDGAALLRYNVGQDGSINWEVIDEVTY